MNTTDTKPKRVCLFAGYHSHGKIADYVVFYVKSLAEFSDVYYMADCEINTAELDKLSPYIKNAWAFRHKKYDFGSWQELISKIGWDTISEYDELIICNDSCFGPLFPLEPLFDKATIDRECDFWGMTDGYHAEGWWFLQSYFLVLKKKVFASVCFQNFIKSIAIEEQKMDVVIKYEIPLSKMLVDNSFKGKRLIEKRYETQHHWRTLIKAGFPFLRVANFDYHLQYFHGENFYKFDQFIKSVSDYDIFMVYSHLESKGFKDNTFGNMYLVKYYIKKINYTMKQMFQIRLSKKRKLIRLFGFNIFDSAEQPKSIKAVESTSVL